jgi:hypothetical protein
MQRSLLGISLTIAALVLGGCKNQKPGAKVKDYEDTEASGGAAGDTATDPDALTSAEQQEFERAVAESAGHVDEIAQGWAQGGNVPLDAVSQAFGGQMAMNDRPSNIDGNMGGDQTAMALADGDITFEQFLNKLKATKDRANYIVDRMRNVDELMATVTQHGVAESGDYNARLRRHLESIAGAVAGGQAAVNRVADPVIKYGGKGGRAVEWGLRHAPQRVRNMVNSAHTHLSRVDDFLMQIEQKLRANKINELLDLRLPGY